MLRIKSKIASVVAHVKSHPAIYGYAAGVVVTATSMALYLESRNLVDMDKALALIKNSNVEGLYYKLDEKTVLLMMQAPENFTDLITQ